MADGGPAARRSDTEQGPTRPGDAHARSSALDDALAFAKAADTAGAGAEIYIYPGAHAFAQPLFTQGRTYDPVAAEAAWPLTEDFLSRRLR